MRIDGAREAPLATRQSIHGSSRRDGRAPFSTPQWVHGPSRRDGGGALQHADSSSFGVMAPLTTPQCVSAASRPDTRDASEHANCCARSFCGFCYKLSRTLAALLRHDHESEYLDDDGFVSSDGLLDILNGRRQVSRRVSRELHGCTMADLERTVQRSLRYSSRYSTWGASI